MTLLTFLRQSLGLTGTKLVCGEGPVLALVKSRSPSRRPSLYFTSAGCHQAVAEPAPSWSPSGTPTYTSRFTAPSTLASRRSAPFTVRNPLHHTHTRTPAHTRTHTLTHARTQSRTPSHAHSLPTLHALRCQAPPSQQWRASAAWPRACTHFRYGAVASLPSLPNRAFARRLHNLQVAMVEHFGSQCGFCTPGMIMTMYAFLRNNPHPTPAEVRPAWGWDVSSLSPRSSDFTLPPHHGLLHRPRPMSANRTVADPRCVGRQPLPLHGLPAHPCCL